MSGDAETLILHLSMGHLADGTVFVATNGDIPDTPGITGTCLWEMCGGGGGGGVMTHAAPFFFNLDI